jgi:putative membrane protein
MHSEREAKERLIGSDVSDNFLRRLYAGLVAFSLLGLMAQKGANVNPGVIAKITPLVVLAVGIGLVYRDLNSLFQVRSEPEANQRAVDSGALQYSAWPKFIGFFIVFLGFNVERLGLLSGWPFGRYVYTENWWPVFTFAGVSNFPLALPFAWFLMSMGSYLVAKAVQPRTGKVPVAVVGGLIAAIADLAMEPAMAGELKYWIWQDLSWPLGQLGAAPLLNFFGWFLTASFAAWAVNRIYEARPLGLVPVNDRTLATNSGIALGGQVILSVAIAIL